MPEQMLPSQLQNVMDITPVGEVNEVANNLPKLLGPSCYKVVPREAVESMNL